MRVLSGVRVDCKHVDLSHRRQVVAGAAFRINYRWYVVAQCRDCGTTRVECIYHAKRPHPHRCKCRRSATRPEYRVWSRMKDRCYNANHVHYDRYGGRGISVCERWRESFDAFHKDMGTRPSAKHEIDRIDNDGDYEPGNCRWATAIQNGRNKRNNRLLTIDGETMCVSDWADQPGAASRYYIYMRLALGWPPSEAVFSTHAHKKIRTTTASGE